MTRNILRQQNVGEFILRNLTLIVAGLLLTSCATSPPPPPAGLSHFNEYDRSVRVSATGKSPPAHARPQTKPKARTPASPNLAAPELLAAATGLFGREETAVYTIKFSGVNAGELTLKTKSPVQINQRKAFSFSAAVRTNKLFSIFFRLRNTLELYFDVQRLVPLTSMVHTEERKKLQETRTLYNWTQLRAEEWENTAEGTEPLKQRKKSWSLHPDAQSLFSSLYFLRTCTLTPGTNITFPISHDEKNFTFEARVLGRETLPTSAGSFETVIVRTSQSFTAIFNKKGGETLLWFSDDNRHLLVGMDVPLKFGRLTGRLSSLVSGKEALTGAGQ